MTTNSIHLVGVLWVAAVRGQVLMCVCWLGVQVRVDVVSFQYNSYLTVVSRKDTCRVEVSAVNLMEG